MSDPARVEEVFFAAVSRSPSGLGGQQDQALLRGPPQRGEVLPGPQAAALQPAHLVAGRQDSVAGLPAEVLGHVRLLAEVPPTLLAADNVNR
jgi:hypothetical protein